MPGSRSNTIRRPVRSFCLFVSQLLLAALIFAGTVLMLRLSGGAVRIANRLGADIMIVPPGYDPHMDNIILAGKPSASYLPDGALEELKALGLDAVERVTPQVFMATLRASCCAYPVQIMGIDYESDFIVRNWLDSSLNSPLNDGEVILGFHSSGQVGDSIIFFGRSLRITGRLERTGTGIDSCVFVNRNTIIDLANAADKIKPQKLAENNNLVSVLMVKLKPGQDSVKTARAINSALNPKGMYALFSKRFVSNISSSLVMTSRIMKIFLAVMLVIIVIVIALLFPLAESAEISIFGVLAGIILGGIIIMAASPYIA